MRNQRLQWDRFNALGQLGRIGEVLRWYPLPVRKPTRRVAIVVPLSNRTDLLPSELTSLRHLQAHLQNYDKFFIAPPELDVAVHTGFQIRCFPNRFFGSAKAHNRLLVWPGFYQAFLNYEFILIYHLDALVFSDQLSYWCDQEYDYIAPPWLKHPGAPYSDNIEFAGKVGCGGFSLRRVRSFLRVLQSGKRIFDSDAQWRRRHGKKSVFAKIGHLPKKYIKRSRYFSGIRREILLRYLPEDSFWANRATFYHPGFKVASVETAVHFGFETLPRDCFAMTGGKLPFGCHAWERYDPDFWQPFVRNSQGESG